VTGESDLRPIIRDAAWLATEAVQLPESKAVSHQSPALPESLSGLIERVTFFDEDNRFGVLKVKAKGHHDPVTVVGRSESYRLESQSPRTRRSRVGPASRAGERFLSDSCP
jgi:hypothetical protein